MGAAVVSSATTIQFNHHLLPPAKGKWLEEIMYKELYNLAKEKDKQ